MVVKLFLLGNPGSGKSTVARYIEFHLRDQGWSVERINDYGILREMFEEDQRMGEGRFKPADHGGFDVLDFKAFDVALQRLEERSGAAFVSSPEAEKRIVLVEFARNDYQKAFDQFSVEFQHSLSDAYYLYLDTEIEICKERISGRVEFGSTPDDYYVSPYIFEAYYHDDNGLSLAQILAKYGVDSDVRVRIIDNNPDLREKAGEIVAFLEQICRSHNELSGEHGKAETSDDIDSLHHVAMPMAATLLI